MSFENALVSARTEHNVLAKDINLIRDAMEPLYNLHWVMDDYFVTHVQNAFKGEIYGPAIGERYYDVRCYSDFECDLLDVVMENEHEKSYPVFEDYNFRSLLFMLHADPHKNYIGGNIESYLAEINGLCSMVELIDAWNSDDPTGLIVYEQNLLINHYKSKNTELKNRLIKINDTLNRIRRYNRFNLPDYVKYKLFAEHGIDYPDYEYGNYGLSPVEFFKLSMEERNKIENQRSPIFSSKWLAPFVGIEESACVDRFVALVEETTEPYVE